MALLRQCLFEVRAASGRGPYDPLPINARDLPPERGTHRPSSMAAPRDTARGMRVPTKTTSPSLT